MAPDGTVDMNVFDIKTGVSIIFGVKKKSLSNDKKSLATVYQADLFGKRAEKFDVLSSSSIETVRWNKLPPEAEVWKIEGEGKLEYEQGISVVELFEKNTTGIVTMGDAFIVDEDKVKLVNRVNDFLENPIQDFDLQTKYGLGKNYAKWVVDNKNSIQNDTSKVVPLAYRPFDIRYTYFDNKLVWRPRTNVMKHFILGDNVGLVFRRQQPTDKDFYIFSSKFVISDGFIRSDNKGSESIAPLYLYENREKVPNLNKEIVEKIEDVVGQITPEDLFDYVYAILHSPTYRTKYGEFLKNDFPRVPYPSNKEYFWKLVPLGTRLRNLHLLAAPEVSLSNTSFPVAGSDIVASPIFKKQRVYINDEQYWEGVSEQAWNFFIGGYQPAQKYLKDRKGKKLSSSEFENYEKMIASLNETMKIMQEIDKVI